MVLANQKTCPPSLFELITLITYLFSLLLFACSCLPSCWPVLAYRSPHPLPYPVCWLINIRDSVNSVFSNLFVLCTNRFSFLVLETDIKRFPPPPGSCHPLFHFSPLTLPFTFLTSFSQLASLPACCCCV